jgi:hypothetical protein
MKRCATIAITLSAMMAATASLNGQVRNSAAAERDYAAAMKADLRQLATAEEAYFMDHNGYYAGTVSASQPLFGFSPSPNVTIDVSAVDGGRQWVAKARHALTSATCTYQMPNPVVCDPQPDTSMFATPRGAIVSSETSGPRSTRLGTAKPVKIGPTRSQSWQFAVRPPRTRCVVSGQVAALSGGDTKVVVLVMTEFAYQDWMKHRPARTYFESAPRTEIPFDVRIEEEGRYRLVVWNPSRKGSTKIVQLEQTKAECSA